MTLKVRRLVTGHDPNGQPVVLVDKEMTNLVSRRPGQLESQIWSTGADFAKDVDDQECELRAADSHIAGGTVFRIVNYAPGVRPAPHRNDWVDYTIVISGEIDMQIGEASEVHLEAGDVVVQRGTMHDWINRGPSIAPLHSFVSAHYRKSDRALST
jgi:quercetin dioxygenase-like cupin family protein